MMISKNHVLTFVAAAAVAVLAAMGPAKAATELTVYTAIEADDLKRYAAAFNKVQPDIKIKWVRDSTGIVTAKLLAEKKNPKADVVWGLAAAVTCAGYLMMRRRSAAKTKKVSSG